MTFRIEFGRQKSTLAGKWSTLLILKDNASTTPICGETGGTFEDPDQGQKGKCQGGPVDEGGKLAIEDCKEGPRDRDGGREIAFWRRKRVRR
jgi:hypothetical protein